jgi:flavodoxin
MSKNKLVIYHSAQGNTERVAKIISEELNCDIIRINDKDKLNSNLPLSSIKIVKQLVRRNQFKSRIEEIDFSQYECIYIGGPCWGYTYSPVVGQFLKKADYRDKEIIFFITHGGDFGKSFEKFKASMVGGKYIGNMDFYMVNKMEENEVRKQVKSQLKKFESM